MLAHGAIIFFLLYCVGCIELVKWLLQQRGCTGNERDYYHSTPLHDAAEHSRIGYI